jgi:hypothetical protein
MTLQHVTSPEVMDPLHSLMKYNKTVQVFERSGYENIPNKKQ